MNFTIKPKAALGIDLGTTFTCVEVITKGLDMGVVVEVVRFGGLETIPSIVRYDNVQGAYQLIAGREAVNENEKNPDPTNYFYGFKRLMGRASLSEDYELRDYNKKVSYQVIEEKVSQSSSQLFMIHGTKENVINKLTAVEASAAILKMIKQEIDLRYEIVETTITVPVYFLENQRNATRVAAEIAGFTNPVLLFEPVAAAYAYQINKNEKSNKYTKYVVYDHGGGTLDVSAFEFGESVLEAPSSRGLRFNGGEDFTKLITEHFEKELKRKGYNINIKSKDYLKLRTLADELKIKVCNEQNDLIKTNSKEIAKVGGNFSTNMGTYYLELDTTTFETIIEPKLKEVRDLFEKKGDGFLDIVNDKLNWKNKIEKVLCVGGSSRIPVIRRMLANYFPGTIIETDIDADKVVGEGAAYFAARSAGMITDAQDISLVTSISIPVGICVDRNVFVKILKEDSTLPAQATQMFTTSQDNQLSVRIRVAQGFNIEFDQNIILGEFEFTLSEQAPRGVPEIEITVDTDMTGEIKVTALNKKTNKSQLATFKSDDASLSPEKIADMKKKAEDNKEKEEEILATIKERDLLEGYITSVKQRVISPEVDDSSRAVIEKELSIVSIWLERERNMADRYSFREKREQLEKNVEALLKQVDKPREEL